MRCERRQKTDAIQHLSHFPLWGMVHTSEGPLDGFCDRPPEVWIWKGKCMYAAPST